MTKGAGSDDLAPFVMRGGGVAIEGHQVLEGVDLTIASGEFVALLGENGSGKTTLLRAFLGLTPLTSGSLQVLGQDVRRFGAWTQIAYVPQRLMAQTAVPVSVAEAVRAARISPLRRFRPDPSGARAATETALQQVGLWSRRHERLDTLSGGQQRRVMVARALAIGARTLLLDEPTAGVDADSELRMADTLADMHADGCTIVLVTHDLGAITEMADHIVVLGGRGVGRVLYDGPPPPPRELYDHVWHHNEDLAPSRHQRPGLVSE